MASLHHSHTHHSYRANAAWVELFATAMESCGENLHYHCERARKAMNDRFVDLAGSGTHSPEQDEIEERLRQLFFHEYLG